MHSADNQAISEILGILLVVTIVSTVVSATLLWAGNYMDSQRFSARVESSLNQMRQIGDVFEEMIGQGEQGSRIVTLSTEQGMLKLSPRGTRFIIYYSINGSLWFNVSGLDDNDASFDIHLYDGTISDLNITYLNTGKKVSYPFSPPAPESNPWNYCNTNYSNASKTISIKNTSGNLYPFVDAVQIDIENNSLNYKEVVGQIWLFDLGMISYDTVSSSGVHNTIVFENGGLLVASGENSYIDKPPILFSYFSQGAGMYEMFYHFKIIQMKPDAEISASPSGGMFKLGFHNVDVNIRRGESYVPRFGIWDNRTKDGHYQVNSSRGTPHRASFNFKIRIYGDYNQSWENFYKDLKMHTLPIIYQYSDGQMYLKDPYTLFIIYISLQQFVTEVDLEEI